MGNLKSGLCDCKSPYEIQALGARGICQSCDREIFQGPRNEVESYLYRLLCEARADVERLKNQPQVKELQAEVERLKESYKQSEIRCADYSIEKTKDHLAILSLQEKLKVAVEALERCDLNQIVDSDFLASIIRHSDAHTRSDKNLAKISLTVRQTLKQIRGENG